MAGALVGSPGLVSGTCFRSPSPQPFRPRQPRLRCRLTPLPRAQGVLQVAAGLTPTSVSAGSRRRLGKVARGHSVQGSVQHGSGGVEWPLLI